MADIAAGDVTYTQNVNGARRVAGTPPRIEDVVQLVFGDNTKTYPTGGIPLTLAGLGLTSFIDSLVVVDQGANAKGYKFEFDRTNLKLLVLIEQAVATNTPLAQHTNATFAPNPATLLVSVKGW